MSAAYKRRSNQLASNSSIGVPCRFHPAMHRSFIGRRAIPTHRCFGRAGRRRCSPICRSQGAAERDSFRVFASFPDSVLLESQSPHTQSVPGAWYETPPLDFQTDCLSRRGRPPRCCYHPDRAQMQRSNLRRPGAPFSAPPALRAAAWNASTSALVLAAKAVCCLTAWGLLGTILDPLAARKTFTSSNKPVLTLLR
jgi:hypothetical protein